MFWNRFFLPSVIVMCAVTVFHWIGTLNDLYVNVFWYDIPMHYFGGVWVALCAMWVISTRYIPCISHLFSPLGILGVVLFVGIAWEVLELLLRFNAVTDVGYISDTLADIVMDMLGALSVVYITRDFLIKK